MQKSVRRAKRVLIRKPRLCYRTRGRGHTDSVGLLRWRCHGPGGNETPLDTTPREGPQRTQPMGLEALLYIHQTKSRRA